jgi:hypothetical protein
MKTAVDWLVDHLYLVIPKEETNFIEGLRIEALEKEKQQIIDACWYGHDIKHEYFNPIHYIDKTYPQNK